jgi:hypothetical protein
MVGLAVSGSVVWMLVRPCGKVKFFGGDDRASAQPITQNRQGPVESSWAPLIAFYIDEWQESAKSGRVQARLSSYSGRSRVCVTSLIQSLADHAGTFLTAWVAHVICQLGLSFPCVRISTQIEVSIGQCIPWSKNRLVGVFEVVLSVCQLIT